MAIMQKILNYFKKKNHFLTLNNLKNIQILKFNPLIITGFLFLFSSLFFIGTSIISKKNEQYTNNFLEITKENEFSNLTNFLLSKLNSPYKEINYIIENNDTVEKILKKFKVKIPDIKSINFQLKQKKLGNIYSGRKLTLIIKKLF